jgi:hypothetical protein
MTEPKGKVMSQDEKRDSASVDAIGTPVVGVSLWG